MEVPEHVGIVAGVSIFWPDVVEGAEAKREMGMSSENAEADAAAVERKQRRNLKKVATIHLVAAMAAITLWGAADTWAAASGWWLARSVALVDAVIAGTILAGIVHEWGHYGGSRLSGAAVEVFEKPIRNFFIFNFLFDRNDRRQFLWLSWGGILTPWILVVATVVAMPVDNPSRAMLLAVLVTRAAQASFFEVPVALRTASGGEPRKELEERLRAGGLRISRYAGLAVGALVFLAA